MDSSSKSSSATGADPFPTDKKEEQRPYPYAYPKDVKVEDLVPNRLRPNNYLLWKRQMLDDVISSKGMLGFIDGAFTAPPENLENEKYVAWKRSDDLVREWIASRLPPDMETWVSRFKTAKEVWDAVPHLVEDMKKRLERYFPLYQAAINGDWQASEDFLEKEPEAVRARITNGSETLLILAARVKRNKDFVEKLLGKMSPDDLALSDDISRTALHRAAGAGNIKGAKLLVEMNTALPDMETHLKETALFYAAKNGDRNMVHLLIEVTKLGLIVDEPRFKILYQLTYNQLFDIALKVLKCDSKLAVFIPKKEEDLKFHALNALAAKTSSFPSGNKFNFLQELIYSRMKIKKTEGMKFPKKKHEGMELQNTAEDHSAGDIEAPLASNNFGAATGGGGWAYKVKKRLHAMVSKVAETLEQSIKPIREIRLIREKRLLHDQADDLLRFLCHEIIRSDFSNADRILRLPLQQATKHGIHEIVELILKSYPYAISLENDFEHSIFHEAIYYRQERVFRLIHLLEEYRVIVFSKRDKNNNNALHLAGLLPPPKILDRTAGAALQMQREWQWFKGVDRLALPENKEEKNTFNKTPEEVFSESHKGLMKDGEKWMKVTASSCTIIASLIATVVFAAAIQVPGGSNAEGHPVFYQNRAFITFGISNALALFSSIASVISFLSILTSRYAAKDFLFTLPKRMIWGLVNLFVSILFTMMAFGCIVYLVFREIKEWILLPVVALGCGPVYLFVVLQFPLLMDMVKSTYFSGVSFQQIDPMPQ